MPPATKIPHASRLVNYVRATRLPDDNLEESGFGWVSARISSPEDACVVATKIGARMWQENHPAPISPEWKKELPEVIASFRETFSSKANYVRVQILGKQVVVLTRQIEELRNQRANTVVIDTMAPDDIQVVKPFHIIVEPYDGEFQASFYDANLVAYGETANEAVWHLKDLIVATFEILAEHTPDQLSAGPARELEVLSQFLKLP